jgi:hypothetical protein
MTSLAKPISLPAKNAPINTLRSGQRALALHDLVVVEERDAGRPGEDRCAPPEQADLGGAVTTPAPAQFEQVRISAPEYSGTAIEDGVLGCTRTWRVAARRLSGHLAASLCGLPSGLRG